MKKTYEKPRIVEASRFSGPRQGTRQQELNLYEMLMDDAEERGVALILKGQA